MNNLNRIELAIRRAASQMPNHQSRAFRLLADTVQEMVNNPQIDEDSLISLSIYRKHQKDVP